MTATTRVAVVGAGQWGAQHARVFAERADTELVAVAGRTTERTAARAEQYGVRPYTDIDLMIEETSPDLISVCLPNEGHYETTRHLIDHGIPLLVEKPLVFDLAEADELLERAARSGPLLRHQLQPSLRRAVPPGQGGHRCRGAR